MTWPEESSPVPYLGKTNLGMVWGMSAPVVHEPSSSTAVVQGGRRVIGVVVLGALAACIALVDNDVVCVVAIIIALVCVLALVSDRRTPNDAQILSDCFGPLRLTAVQALEVARGEQLDVEIELPVRLATHVERATLSLKRLHRRDQVFATGSVAKYWLCDYRKTVDVVEAAREVDADDVLSGTASYAVPRKEPPTGSLDRWILVFEMVCADRPAYEASYRVTVT